MAGFINSPLDRGQFSLAPDEGSPPIIPGLTQMAPGIMRAIQRHEMGYDEESSMPESPSSPEEMFSAFASLFAQAGEYPGLQDSILAMLTQMKLAYDREAMMPPLPQMPQPIPSFTQQIPQQPPPFAAPPQNALPSFPLR